ncbi:MAG: GTP-binding protein [Cyanobacteriota bacterium]|nr:GTP-binding protein [Cyanobacteriota bacterium]
MKLPPRLWLWLLLSLAAALVLALLLQTVNQLLWQLSYWLPPGLVGPLLLLALLAVGLTALQLGGPWLGALRRRQRARPSTTPPPLAGSRREAATRQLEAIDQTLERLRDAVEREALRQERERMAAELERGDLRIVVFGGGSVGKTSLIRALLGELVGEVGAAMGSTRSSRAYRLRLSGLPRAVILEDTPGILEAGVDGRERERLARQQAARADLLVLVVDGDLRQSEQRVFDALASLGKRLLLVLNKCDLRGDDDERRLLDLLRRRCRDRLAPDDVLATSAAPQSVPMPGGRPHQPMPEVGALLQRLAAVLHADGEELIADNLLLQSRRLGDSGRQLLARQRRRDGERIVERYMWVAAGAVAVTPLPGVDLLAAAAVNSQMVIELGRVHGVELTQATARDLALSVGRTLATLGLVKGGVGLLSTALSVSLPSLLVGRAIQAVTTAWLTRVAGLSFITYFQQDQDWGDGGAARVLQQQYDLNRREGALQRFLEAALSRVVEPLRRQPERELPPQVPGRRRGPPAAAAEAAPGHPEPGSGPDRPHRSGSKWLP